MKVSGRTVILTLSVILALNSHGSAFTFGATKRGPSIQTRLGMEGDGLHVTTNNNHENDFNSNNNDDESSPSRRAMIFNTLFTTTAITASMLTIEPPSAEAAFPLFLNSKYSLSVVANKNSTAAASIRQPNKEAPIFSKDLLTESCLLKLLPVKKPIFRKLEKDILQVNALRAFQSDKQPPTDKAFEDVAAKMKEAVTYFDNQRNNLEPVFNLEESTQMTITKTIRCESLLESLRSELSSIVTSAEKMDETAVYGAQRRALRILAEVGELLVDRFPFDVPSEGKFSYLPRLLGRAKVTFTITRPARPPGKGRMAAAASSSSSSSGKDVVMGNVTILADGFAAPITAGNFVDLASRSFYTGLPAKAMKKRLGVTPTLTTGGEDSVVAYDIASTVDKLTGEGGLVSKTLGNFMEKIGGVSSDVDSDDDGTTSGGTILTSMPIMGSFNEGFYDPLTAKPRRIPLEIVQYDRISSTAKLSYETGFSSASSAMSSSPTFPSAGGTNSTSPLRSVLNPTLPVPPLPRSPPLLTFDIPGLVAMNHPDKNLNGGSSEFFCLTDKDLNPDRTSLLDCNYAPFGYVIEGLDIMKQIQAGDTITATYVNDWGQMSLKKIRGATFADAMNQDDEA